MLAAVESAGRWGEVGAAYVIPRLGADPDADELCEFARARLAKYKVPVHWNIVLELPRTGSGKVRKPDLRKRSHDSTQS